MADVKLDDLNQSKPVKKKSGFKRVMRNFLLVLILFLGVYVWWQYFYVFGEGVKAGQLNYVVKKGNVFKTYEGKLILYGFKSKVPGMIGSETFEFSIADDSIANVLMTNSGKAFELHYKEYKNSLPWRGYTPYIVDKIMSMKDIDPNAP